ncbi:MAG: Exopolyphosphatase [Chlamydiae bacterium]|nr:Exopolyphosphatase [Chlamydiota bacterium]
MPDTSRSFKLFIIGVLLIFASLIPYYYGLHQVKTQTVIRAAIDIGSGATKLRVAEIDLSNNKIVKTLVNTQITVSYQKVLTEGDQAVFDEQVMQQGIEAIKELKQLAIKYQAQKVIGIATSAFRKAENGEEFVKRITEETGIPIYIIDQKLEGELGFLAVEATVPVDEKTMIVWDIGGGSLQLTMMGTDEEMKIYRGHEASIPFKNYIIQNIQSRNVKEYSSPNPMTLEEMDDAEKHARMLAKNVDQLFKDRIKDPNTKVYGVGSIFSYGIEPLVMKNPFTAKDLRDVVTPLAGKTDEELGGGDFADVLISNALLVIGFMKELDLQQVQVVDVNNADGAFFMKSFWKVEKAIPNKVN